LDRVIGNQNNVLKQIAEDVIDAVKNTLTADRHQGLVGAGETRVFSAGQNYAGT
jgi:hypothetical protein